MAHQPRGNSSSRQAGGLSEMRIRNWNRVKLLLFDGAHLNSQEPLPWPICIKFNIVFTLFLLAFNGPIHRTILITMMVRDRDKEKVGSVRWKNCISGNKGLSWSKNDPVLIWGRRLGEQMDWKAYSTWMKGGRSSDEDAEIRDDGKIVAQERGEKTRERWFAGIRKIRNFPLIFSYRPTIWWDIFCNFSEDSPSDGRDLWNVIEETEFFFCFKTSRRIKEWKLHIVCRARDQEIVLRYSILISSTFPAAE